MATKSIVDFLKSQGKDSSFSARAELAKQQGITNFKGTAKQNLKLLSILQQDKTDVDSSQPLKGTLSGTDPGVASTQEGTTSTTPTSLGDFKPSSFSANKNIANQVAQQIKQTGPSVKEILQTYTEQGLGFSEFGQALDATESFTGRRQSAVDQQLNTVLDLINDREKRQTEYVNTVMASLPKDFITTMTGQEFEELKSGVISPELRERIQDLKIQEDKLSFAELKEINDALPPDQRLPFGSTKSDLEELKVVPTSATDQKFTFQKITDAFGNEKAGAFNSALGTFTPIDLDMPDVQSEASSFIGSGVITGYGSSKWSQGLDFVVKGGKGAPLTIPFNFTVKEVLSENESQGFGNQVKVVTPTGQEVWFSHLDEINLSTGQYDAGTQIGTQGNTGNVLAGGKEPTAEQLALGAGTHVDITMPKVPNPKFNDPSHWFSPEEVAQFMGIGSPAGMSFEEYVMQEQEKAGQSFSKQKIKQIKSEFDELQGAQKEMGPLSPSQQIAMDIMNPFSNATIDDVLTKQKPAVLKELNKLKEKALESGNLEGIIKASAGGKPVDATFTQSFEKVLNTLGQLEDLKDTLENGTTLEDGTEVKGVTGPIVGIIRSNNPFDVQAQQIKAQLTSLIPNLARGVYGEVGVLTDNDVKLYSQTLPNLSSVEDVQKAVLGITIRAVQRSLENKIKVQAGFGRDMSGILPVYQDLKEQADNLLSGVTPKQGSYATEINGKVFSFPTQKDLNNFLNQIQ